MMHIGTITKKDDFMMGMITMTHGKIFWSGLLCFRLQQGDTTSRCFRVYPWLVISRMAHGRVLITKNEIWVVWEDKTISPDQNTCMLC